MCWIVPLLSCLKEKRDGHYQRFQQLAPARTTGVQNAHICNGHPVGVGRCCSVAGKGEAEAHGMDHWALVGQKLTAEKHLADDAKKVRVHVGGDPKYAVGRS